MQFKVSKSPTETLGGTESQALPGMDCITRPPTLSITMEKRRVPCSGLLLSIPGCRYARTHEESSTARCRRSKNVLSRQIRVQKARQEAIRRANGVCQICRQPLNPQADRFSPDSTEVDRKRPLGDPGRTTASRTKKHALDPGQVDTIDSVPHVMRRSAAAKPLRSTRRPKPLCMAGSDSAS